MVMKMELEKTQEKLAKMLREVQGDFGITFLNPKFVFTRGGGGIGSKLNSYEEEVIRYPLIRVAGEILDDDMALCGFLAHECEEVVKYKTNPIYRQLNDMRLKMRQKIIDDNDLSLTKILLEPAYFILRYALESYIDNESKKKGYEAEIAALRKHIPKIPKWVLK
jgi:hypothetical protein